MIEDIVKGGVHYVSYDSLDEFADAAIRRADGFHARRYNDDWCGASWDEALNLARTGWTEQLDAAMQIAESAIELAEKEQEIEVFAPVWDVTGSEVDVARYLAGTPENMIDFPSATISKVGSVITLCASVCYSASIGPETIIRRGQVITALALALSRLGHSVEMWADVRASGNGKLGEIVQRVMVKGANDVLDPARVLFAYAHPAMLRRLMFAVAEGNPGRWKRNKGLYGSPKPPMRDLPEGTIYLPEICSDEDVPDAHEFLRDTLRELGLLAE